MLREIYFCNFLLREILRVSVVLFFGENGLAVQILQDMEGGALTSSSHSSNVEAILNVGSSGSSNVEAVLSEGSTESSNGFILKKCDANGKFRNVKQKWCAVSGGTVSSVLGKSYIRSRPVGNGSCVATKPLKLDEKEFPTSELWGEEPASSLIAAQQFELRFHICTDNSTYTANSSYPSNLNATLSSLYENASRSDGFGSISVGNNSDRVFALFQCRGDDSPESCRGCIKTAREEIKIRCPNYKEAIIWYDRCMLRYSNRSIFSVTEEWPKAWLWNPNDIGNAFDQNQFNFNLGGLMNQLINSASSSSNVFAMGDTKGTEFNRIYGTVQCTPDISPYECRMCLFGRLSDIPTCCNEKPGGNLLTPSCSMRFETYPFYTAPPAPSPPASSPSPPTPPPTSLNPSVPTSAFVVLFFSICYCYVHKKAKKENSAMKGGNDAEKQRLLDWSIRTITDEVNTSSKEFLSDQSKTKSDDYSVDEASITEVYPR
ncbi:hypothetical protein DKX38_005438 [Salix brachista]|uniref:Gnk2-homologous domain-containing protein n=2 Tax=Salix TaxID=40685 RepID=A0A5N5N209_9ROSI|nr:hypothetical protein DKX38_005438 [Salix brachista]